MSNKYITSKYWRLRYFPRTGGGVPIKTIDQKKPIAATPTNQGSLV